MDNKKIEKEQFKVYLTEGLKKEIKKYCVDEDISMSEKTEELWRKEMEK